jgi:site-specific DNA-adenine methylase
VWINDLNADLVAFWTMARDENTQLVRDLLLIRNRVHDGRLLFDFWREYEPTDEYERALRYAVVSRRALAHAGGGRGSSRGGIAGSGATADGSAPLDAD